MTRKRKRRSSIVEIGKPHRAWPPKALVEDMLASGLSATGKRHPAWGNSND